MSLCVVIPTCNRENILKLVLLALEKQTIRPDSVLIVNDSSDTTALNFMKDVEKRTHLKLKVLQNQPSKGPAAARNKAVLKAREDNILFINDDTIPENDKFIENHLKFSKAFPGTAILGKLEWHKDTSNNFLKGYFTYKLGFFACSKNEKYLKNSSLDYTKYCTANLFIPRKILLKYPFDEGFLYPALEDTEWGYRLQKGGFFLKYNPNSTVLHHHIYTPDMIEKRQEKIGVSLVRLLKLHPELDRIYGPKIPRTLCNILYFGIKTPVNKMLPLDLRYFLIGLLTKYKFYWDQVK